MCSNLSAPPPRPRAPCCRCCKALWVLTEANPAAQATVAATDGCLDALLAMMGGRSAAQQAASGSGSGSGGEWEGADDACAAAAEAAALVLYQASAAAEVACIAAEAAALVLCQARAATPPAPPPPPVARSRWLLLLARPPARPVHSLRMRAASVVPSSQPPSQGSRQDPSPPASPLCCRRLRAPKACATWCSCWAAARSQRCSSRRPSACTGRCRPARRRRRRWPPSRAAWRAASACWAPPAATSCSRRVAPCWLAWRPLARPAARWSHATRAAWRCERHHAHAWRPAVEGWEGGAKRGA